MGINFVTEKVCNSMNTPKKVIICFTELGRLILDRIQILMFVFLNSTYFNTYYIYVSLKIIK